MNELHFSDSVLARLRGSDEEYHERAYLFVLATIEFLQSRLEVRRHVTGQELAWACRDFAVERFGLLARPVLEHWGVRRTEDIGRIVYSLVQAGLLAALPTDREEEFAAVYAFEDAFSEDYDWGGVGKV
ncbi:MAG TPA: Minf_1886 family protein [Gemmatimonadales bacterium]|nr:Minf_1886 family protein [Gemmatimonadales bacterium]